MSLPSPEYLIWLRENGFDRDPPKSTEEKNAEQRRRIIQVEHRIEKALDAAGAADDRMSRERFERRAETLQNNLDTLTADLFENEGEPLFGFCPVCGRGIDSKTIWNYGRPTACHDRGGSDQR